MTLLFTFIPKKVRGHLHLSNWIVGLKGVFQTYFKDTGLYFVFFKHVKLEGTFGVSPPAPTKLLTFGITRFCMFFSLVQFTFSLWMKVLGPWPMGFTIILSKKWGILRFHMPWPKHFNVHTQNNSGVSLPSFLNTMQKYTGCK